MPPGRNFAPDRAQNAHNNFQDPIAFIKRGGVKGIQLAHAAAGTVADSSVSLPRLHLEGDDDSAGQGRRRDGPDGDPLDPAACTARPSRPQKLSGRRAASSPAAARKGRRSRFLRPAPTASSRSPSRSKAATRSPASSSSASSTRRLSTRIRSGSSKRSTARRLDPRDYVATQVDGHDNFTGQQRVHPPRRPARAAEGHTPARHLLHQPARLQGHSREGEAKSSRARSPSSSRTSAKTRARKCAARWRIKCASAWSARRSSTSRMPPRASTSS
jgi:hypothetical protein